jgi:hypothetical protein
MTYLFPLRSLYPRCPHIHITLRVQHSYARDEVFDLARGFWGLCRHRLLSERFIAAGTVVVVVDMTIGAVDVALEQGFGANIHACEQFVDKGS